MIGCDIIISYFGGSNNIFADCKCLKEFEKVVINLLRTKFKGFKENYPTKDIWKFSAIIGCTPNFIAVSISMLAIFGLVSGSRYLFSLATGSGSLYNSLAL